MSGAGAVVGAPSNRVSVELSRRPVLAGLSVASARSRAFADARPAPNVIK